jgi:mannose-1-phosphate guanylyltransferase/mannose-6-phosphate isomerase
MACLVLGWITFTNSMFANLNHHHVILLAGGSGTRLWPLSRQLTPKQLLAFDGEHSLLQMTAHRLLAEISPEHLHTVTHMSHKFEVLKQLQVLHSKLADGVLAEPEARNTLPAIAWAVAKIARMDPEAIVSVFSSDQAVRDEEAFRIAWRQAVQSVNQFNVVLFGIVPTRPATGYGYIEAAASAESVRPVKRFVEKPDLAMAQKWLKQGGFYWNGGMFVFRASKFLELLKTHQPEAAAVVTQLVEASSQTVDAATYAKLPKISIDYGLLEKISNVGVVPADIGWTDLGSWQAIYDYRAKDAEGNVCQGDVISLENKNSLLWSEGRTLAAFGLKELAVLQTADATLVCPLDRAEDLKKIVTTLQTHAPTLLDAHLTVSRPWGSYTVLEDAPQHKVKRICVQPGCKLSLQSHAHRKEHWVVLKGEALVQINETEHLLKSGQAIDICVGDKHRLSNPGAAVVEIIEIQTGTYFGEDDIVRYEDQYGRSSKQ